MKYSILLSLITLVASNATTETVNDDARIVNGFQVESIINYQAALVWHKDNELFCGGSIIAENWILTAAHCAVIEPETFYVRVGSLRYDTGGQTVQVRRIISHPKYYNNIAGTGYDIALLEVDNIQFNEQVYAISLPNENEFPPTGTTLLVSGWGDTSWEGKGSSNLLAVYMQLTDWNECHKVYGNIITKQMICAYAEGTKDPCQGDSGGPMAMGNTLIGIVSLSWCAKPDKPSVYTPVANSEMRGFIKEHTGI